jgi:ribonucleoside-diphosphate reductase alpha chain
MTPEARTKAPAVPAIKLSRNALFILEKRYLKKDEQGKIIETPQALFRRVAQAVAAAELIYNPAADIGPWVNKFYGLMSSLEFLPNSPTLLNAGAEPGQLSSCFALPVEDSIDSIFETVKNTALVHKSGGGTGFNFSRLRPRGDRVGSMAGIAGGPVSFLNIFSTTADSIKQGGIRRGCNLALLNVSHPDVVEFIVAKQDQNALTNFYLSVVVTAAFMQAVKDGGDYDIVNPRTNQVTARLNAREVFDLIVKQTWRTGDPGIIFIDRIEGDNPTPHLGKISAVSGCGEQPLLPYESCNLGSINLVKMLKSAGRNVKIDFAKLARTTKLAVRFLDNVIDVSSFPVAQTEQAARNTRKIGLGVMGFADMLIQLGIPYDSEEAPGVAGDVMRFINEEAHKASVALAAERGVFPAFEGADSDTANGYRLRNATCTTIAPSGTISLIAGCSSGIEPVYAMVMLRRLQDGSQLLEVNPHFLQLAKEYGFYSEELMEKLACQARLDTIESVPENIKRLLVTATEIKPEWHIRMQAAFQRHTDNGVSKTVNLPQQATRKDIARAYMMAYEEGLKGITIYRDKSRRRQPLCASRAGLQLMRNWLSRNAG